MDSKKGHLRILGVQQQISKASGVDAPTSLGQRPVRSIATEEKWYEKRSNYQHNFGHTSS